jgi:hypothetical protein
LNNNKKNKEDQGYKSNLVCSYMLGLLSVGLGS